MAKRERVASSQTEISYLHNTSIVHQNVLGLDISVNNTVAVNVVQTTEELVHNGLDHVLWHTRLKALQIALQIIVHILEIKLHLCIVQKYVMQSTTIMFSVSPPKYLLDNIGMMEIAENGNLTDKDRGDSFLLICNWHDL